MLVPHFWLGGRCEEAIGVYEKAFDTKADYILYNRDFTGNEIDAGIAHAEMRIHGQRVMMNDRFGNNDKAVYSVQIVLIFETEEELMRCYDMLKDGCAEIDPLQRTSYSPLVTIFIDRFGIQWSFMVEKTAEADT